MSKSIKAGDFQFGYQYDQQKRADRKQLRQQRQQRQGKHDRFIALDSNDYSN